MRRTGQWELTTRWTMTLSLTLSRALGPLQSLWSPTLTFTGVLAWTCPPRLQILPCAAVLAGLPGEMMPAVLLRWALPPRLVPTPCQRHKSSFSGRACV